MLLLWIALLSGPLAVLGLDIRGALQSLQFIVTKEMTHELKFDEAHLIE